MPKTKQEIIAAALAYEYDDKEACILDAAKEHCIANMGQQLGDFLYGTGLADRPNQVIRSCYNTFYQQSESDEMAEGIQDEMRSWIKDARQDVEKVIKMGLPLTLANVRMSFMYEGPFAKKKASKKRKKV